ncbi:hypothetical protein G6F22_018471 [Rhizopus arrhizus]|nr:hypothetical protein G6F22_018471 [Rhizopus arrhizus]
MSNVSNAAACPAPAGAGWACGADAQRADRARASASGRRDPWRWPRKAMGCAGRGRVGGKRWGMTEPVRSCNG